MAAGLSVSIPGTPGAQGQNMGAGVQVIGGQQYQMYSPQWYQAQRSYAKDASSAAGTAAGSFTNSYMNTAFPSLAGLSGAGAAGTFGLGGSTAGTGTAGAAGAPGSSGPVGGGTSVAPLQMPDQSAKNAAIFAQAKDQVGQMSRASLDSLAGELGSEGMLGGGAQAQATRDIISQGEGQLGDTVRANAVNDANLAADFAKTNYQGALTERGQNIQAQEANARLALEQRAQQYQLLNTILNSIGKVGSSSVAAPTGLMY